MVSNASTSNRLFDSDDFSPETVKMNCLLCKAEFAFPHEEESLMAHLFQEHRLVIGDRHLIASLKSYMDYWRTRLQAFPMSHFCTVILADLTEPSGVFQQQQECYLLSDILPEDRSLREGLQKKRLDLVLEHQRIEREDNKFSRCCLFCRSTLVGTRAEFLTHLSEQHNLQLGRPQNLVQVDRLLDHIEELINKFTCLFCEKIFKDRLILREHMRKKHHKRVNPKNKFYDQFYVVNYLELGKDWHQVEEETEEHDSTGNQTSGSEAGDDWADWQESSGQPILCLFCQHSSDSWDEILHHLESEHQFPFLEHTKNLDFYQKVKAVNYIRKTARDNICIACEEQKLNTLDLTSHMKNESHYVFPSKERWDQPEFYFPTCEDDGFLCQLDDGRGDDEGTPDCVVSEDLRPEVEAIDILGEPGMMDGLEKPLSALRLQEET